MAYGHSTGEIYKSYRVREDVSGGGGGGGGGGGAGPAPPPPPIPEEGKHTEER